MLRPSMLLFLGVSLLLGAAASPRVELPPDGAEEESRWYVVEMLGQRSGYFHTEVRHGVEDGRPVVRDLETLHNQLVRSNAGVTETVAVTSKTIRRSTPAGATLSVESVLDQGGGEVRSLVEVQGATAVVTLQGASGERTMRMPWDEEALSPWVAEEALQSLVRGDEDEVRYKIFSFEAGNVLVEMTARVLERRPDGTVQLEQDFGGLGAKALEIYSADGVLLRQEVGPVILRLATREEALAPLENSLRAFERITVSLDRSLRRPRSLARGRYGLVPRPEGGALELTDLFVEDGRQTIDQRDGVRVLTVTVEDTPWTEDSFEADPYLRPSSLIESDDPEILRVAQSLMERGDGPREVAHRLERWVHEQVLFTGAGIGLASARSTLDAKDGDCTENAFLLAALLRAAKIPSRIVVGLVAVGSTADAGSGKGTSFVPHAWVEAWIEARVEPRGRSKRGNGKKERGWIALDSAIYGPSVDATHLAMAKSDGAEEGAIVQVTAPLLQGLGKFDLRWLGEDTP